MRAFKNYLAVAALCLAGLTATANAGVIISGTRQVYPAQEKEITVRLHNNDQKFPRLVQTWIDNGDEKLSPEKANVPFTITPPIFRIEPNADQTLRIVYTKEPLPTDKETVFWLNVLEVPPKPTDGVERNSLQFAFRIRTKLFFRPAGLPGNVSDAPKQLTWSIASESGKQVLEVRNPTPYFVSFQSVGIESGGQTVESEDNGMVAPGGTQRFTFKGGMPASGARVKFKAINDFGSFVTFEAAITK